MLEVAFESQPRVKLPQPRPLRITRSLSQGRTVQRKRPLPLPTKSLLARCSLRFARIVSSHPNLHYLCSLRSATSMMNCHTGQPMDQCSPLNVFTSDLPAKWLEEKLSKEYSLHPYVDKYLKWMAACLEQTAREKTINNRRSSFVIDIPVPHCSRTAAVTSDHATLLVTTCQPLHGFNQIR
jgi:hypothetical protein